MFKGVTRPVAIAAAGLFLGLAVPAMAGSDLRTEEFEVIIAKAKSQMMADPAAALSLAREAKALVEDNSKAAVRRGLTARWLEGEALMRLNRGEEAADLIESALSQASASFEEDKIYADLLRSTASSKARAGDFDAALSHFQMASEKYRLLGDARSLAIVLQNIGSVYSQGRDYKKVLQYYREAAETFNDEGPLALSAHNNIGNALKGLGRYDEAEVEFAQALIIARKMSSPMIETRVLTNLASTQLLSGAANKAQITAKRALVIAEDNAPTWKPFVYGVLAQVELDRGNLALAEEYIGRTFYDRSLGSTNTLFRDFHETAATIFRRTGKGDISALHLAALERLKG